MIGIAHQQRAVHGIGAQDGRHAMHRLLGVVTLGLGDQVHIGNAPRFEIIAANLAFAVAWIPPRAAGGDDDRRQPALKQLIRVVEAGAVNRRGMADVLCRAKDDDGVGSMRFIHLCLAHDLRSVVKQKSRRDNCSENDNPDLEGHLGILLRRGHYSRPSSRQLPSSLVRSTIVEGMSRGERPPSTITCRQSPNWSRTSMAEVHSTSPWRLAEVAVMGKPAARIMASGISAAGTRSATLPVFAVTLSGSLGSALTMMVSGPGQKRRASK